MAMLSRGYHGTMPGISLGRWGAGDSLSFSPSLFDSGEDLSGMTSDKVIEIAHLSYHYPDGTPGLRDIRSGSLPAESVAILGPNGAGKSTLLYHLNGTLMGEGSDRVLGMPVEKKNLKEIRKKVGVVFQNPEDQLFCPTVFDDVAFGPLNMGLSQRRDPATSGEGP